MTLLEAIILAAVQGITEFLPISSTAHLILIPWLVGWHDPGLTFDIALHAGTLLAVLVYFARTWWRLFVDSFRCLAHRMQHRGANTPGAAGAPALAPDVELNFTLMQLLVVGTIPAGFAGYFLESYAESSLRSPYILAGMLIGVSVVMWIADRRPRLVRGIRSVGFVDAIIIGLAQAVSVVPGTSRSGATITAGLFLDLTRESAARFSFLLATPIIGGATVKKALEVWQHGLPKGATPADFLVGFAVSALVGYAAIDFLLRYLQVRTLKIFIAYRVVLGVIILAVEFLRLAS